MVSGGANGGPQYNPANISATGGAGQSGKNTQPKRYMPGMKSLGSTGVATMAQEGGADLYAAPETPTSQPRDFSLTSPTNNPSEPLTAGVDTGPGVGSSALPKNISAETRNIDNKAIIQKYFPALLRASQLEDTPDSYKRFISYLSGQIYG